MTHYYALFYRVVRTNHAKWGPQYQHGYLTLSREDVLIKTEDIDNEVIACLPVGAELTGITYLGAKVQHEQAYS